MQSVEDKTTPGGMVGGKGLPRINIKSVLKPLSLPADCALALPELPVKQLFGDAVVSHMCDVSCPSDLSLAHNGEHLSKYQRVTMLKPIFKIVLFTTLGNEGQPCLTL